MSNSDMGDYHKRVAARLRSLLAIACTPAFLKAQIAQKAEKHEQLARMAEILKGSPLQHAAD